MVSIPVIARSGRAKRGGATKQSLHAISYMISAKIVRRDCFVAQRTFPPRAPRNDGDGDPGLKALDLLGLRLFRNSYFVNVTLITSFTAGKE